MFKFIKNEDGIALLMVIVLLVLVGGLTAALMSAGVFNIRFGGDEVERNQGLYAADAGIEYLKNEVRKLEDENDKKSKEDTDIDFLKDGPLTRYVDEDRKIEFKLDRIGNSDNDNIITFSSIGKINGDNIYNIIIEYDNREKIDFENLTTDKTFNSEGSHFAEHGRLVGDLANLNFEFPEEFQWEVLKYYIENGEDFSNDDNILFFDHTLDGEEDFKNAGLWEEYIYDENGKPEEREGGYIENKVILVDGDFKTPGESLIKNSIIIADGDFDFRGDNVLDNSLFFNSGNFEGRGIASDSFVRSIFYIYGEDSTIDLHGSQPWSFDISEFDESILDDLLGFTEGGYFQNWRIN